MKPLKTLIKIVVFLLIVNAMYNFVPPYYRFSRFRAAAQDLALQARGKSESAVVGEVMELASVHRIPIEREWIEVRRSPDQTHTYIDATWAETIRFLPAWKKVWIFNVNVDGWHVKPVTAKDIR